MQFGRMIPRGAEAKCNAWVADKASRCKAESASKRSCQVCVEGRKTTGLLHSALSNTASTLCEDPFLWYHLFIAIPIKLIYFQPMIWYVISLFCFLLVLLFFSLRKQPNRFKLNPFQSVLSCRLKCRAPCSTTSEKKDPRVAIKND